MSLLDHPEFIRAADLHKAGHFDEAEHIYQKLIEENPNDPDLWHFRGLLALHKGHAEDAIRHTALAIVLKPGMPDYFQTLALAYYAAGQPQKAAESFNKQGNALQEQCRFIDSLGAYDAALTLKPEFVSVIMNRGAALDRLGRYGEARSSFETGLALLPEPTGPHELLNAANALSGLGRSEEAVVIYDQLLALQPDNATAHCSKSLLLLRLGRLAEGWREYEWRWVRDGGFKEPRGHFHQPVWRGEPADDLGGPLLVIAEQGFGDVIQFARYVPLLAEQGYDVIFETLPELTTLFREGFDHHRIHVIPRIENPLEVEDDLPFVAWVGVMSLPERFGSTLDNIPAHVPYLAVDAAKVERWRERLPAGDMRKVGLVWAGNPKNLNDHARSVPAEELGPLLAVPGVAVYSLQKGPAAAHDFKAANPSPSAFGIGKRPLPLGRGESSAADITKLGDELTDFTETAAAILNLDLVITVDTSVAHLAGALGKPVWLMIPAVVDWRWLNHGDTTPWYPTMRIFRQVVRGEWGSVIEEVATALQSELDSPPVTV